MNLLKKDIIGLINNAEISYVATSDKNGYPHLAVEKGLKVLEEKYLGFSAWFCNKTVENLCNNPKITIAIFDPLLKKGYQFSGEVIEIKEGAMLNGFSPELEKKEREFPQVERRLKIKIDEVLDFSTGAHSDKNIL